MLLDCASFIFKSLATELYLLFEEHIKLYY